MNDDYQPLTVSLPDGEPRIARITLKRPARLNAICEAMPVEIRRAAEWASASDEVHVVVLDGAGRALCAGYDLQDFSSARTEHPCTLPGARRRARLRGRWRAQLHRG